MSLKGKKVYTRKSANGRLYKWAPQSDKTKQGGGPTQPQNLCNAVAFGSDGVDGITKYVTKREVVDGVVRNYAYVACDYVE